MAIGRALDAEGLSVARQTLHRWLAEDLAAGKVTQAKLRPVEVRQVMARAAAEPGVTLRRMSPCHPAGSDNHALACGFRVTKRQFRATR